MHCVLLHGHPYSLPSRARFHPPAIGTNSSFCIDLPLNTSQTNYLSYKTNCDSCSEISVVCVYTRVPHKYPVQPEEIKTHFRYELDQ